VTALTGSDLSAAYLAARLGPEYYGRITLMPNIMRRTQLVYWHRVLIGEIDDAEVRDRGWERIEFWIYVESRMPQQLTESRLWC
jgi:hypothetical protein